MTGVPVRISRIVLPTRPQPDTLVAIFMLKRFGEAKFPGISAAVIDFWQVVPEGESAESLEQKGVLLIDLGAGMFDHHPLPPKTATASSLVAKELGIAEDPALTKLLAYAERDDFWGKGTVSDDPIDRAFGLSAIVAALNKNFVKDPGHVVDVVLPLIAAHYEEEHRRANQLPAEFQEKMSRGEVDVFEVKQRGKKLKGAMLTSESPGMAGYLRSGDGKKFDVVAIWLPSGHVNILTRPVKHIDLRSLAVLLRLQEADKTGRELDGNPRALAKTGRLPGIPEWYYDPATNSIQNGGLNPKEVTPTKIPKDELLHILKLGLAEEGWNPQMP